MIELQVVEVHSWTQASIQTCKESKHSTIQGTYFRVHFFNSAHRTGGLELALQLYIRGNSVKHAYSIPGVDVVPRFWVLMGLAHTTWARAQAQARMCKSGGPREKEFEALLLSAKNGATWSQVQWLQVQVCPLNCHFLFILGFIFKGWTRSPLF